MPSHPPETQFYQNDENYTLWRDESRLFESFLGEDESQWPERTRRFETVMSDVSARLRGNKDAGN